MLRKLARTSQPVLVPEVGANEPTIMSCFIFTVHFNFAREFRFEICYVQICQSSIALTMIVDYDFTLFHRSIRSSLSI